MLSCVAQRSGLPCQPRGCGPHASKREMPAGASDRGAALAPAPLRPLARPAGTAAAKPSGVSTAAWKPPQKQQGSQGLLGGCGCEHAPASARPPGAGILGLQPMQPQAALQSMEQRAWLAGAVPPTAPCHNCRPLVCLSPAGTWLALCNLQAISWMRLPCPKVRAWRERRSKWGCSRKRWAGAEKGGWGC